jgi:cytoskeletal protein CcmA (bactofilin family)
MAKNQNNSYTFLGAGTEFEGTIYIPHEIRISGSFTGKITTDDTIIVGKDGKIKGEITSKNAIIAGEVEGNLICTGKVELEGKSSFMGDITSKELVINQGAIFYGMSKMFKNDLDINL